MINQKTIALLAALVVAVGILAGCSGGGQTAVTPSVGDANISTDGTNQRSLWGMWNFYCDPAGLDIRVEPIRNALAHFEIPGSTFGPTCPGCIEVKVDSFDQATRVMDVDVGLRNGFSAPGFDVRGILYSDSSGVKLVNADDWTGRFDVPGGDVLNPFKSFAKNSDSRVFSSNTMHSENFKIYFPEGTNYKTLMFAVDVSFPKNCLEPYEIKNFWQEKIRSSVGSKGSIFVDVLDWQDDVNKVSLVLPEVTGTQFRQLEHFSGPTWTAEIENATGTGPGVYTARVIATSIDATDSPLYDYIDIIITPSKNWALTWGSESGDDKGLDSAIDSSGNIFVTGYFGNNYNPSVDFDPGPMVDEHSTNGGEDAFLAKYGPNGDYLWALTWGGPASDRGNSVAIDSFGDVYVAGWFKGAVDFDPGAGVETRFSNGDCDAYLAKFDNNGNLLWVDTWGGSNWDYCCAVTVDNMGYVSVAGAFQSKVDFDPGPGSMLINSAGGEDAFASRFDSNGGFMWVNTWGGDSVSVSDVGRAVTVDSNGNLFVTGETEVDDDMVSVLNKISPNGDTVWFKTWGEIATWTPGYEPGRGIAVDENGDIYVTGWFQNTVDFDPDENLETQVTSNGGRDAFLSKFTTYGEFLWVRAWGGNDWDEGLSATIDSQGDICIAGYFQGKPDFDPGVGNTCRNSKGGRDIFMSRFTPDGEFLDVSTFGGDCWDEGIDVETTSAGETLITGYFQGTVDFDPGQGIDNHASNGFYDIFISKLIS